MTKQTQHNERITSAKTVSAWADSKDGQWQTSNTVPNLLRYVKTGTYYGRFKISGKVTRRSLQKPGETEISFSTAKLRLADLKKELAQPKPTYGTFADARTKFEAALSVSGTVNEKSREYRRLCILKIQNTWRGIDALKVADITEQDCLDWAAKLKVAPQYFNNLIATLRMVLDRAELPKNPAKVIARRGIPLTPPTLPEPEQFDKILAGMLGTNGKAKDCADYIAFLAYSGCRTSEAQAVTWADVDFDGGFIRVRQAKQWKTKNHSPFRDVPIIAKMRTLLEQLKKERSPKPDHKVCLVLECRDALAAACKKAQAARITHHDLRHLFATQAIQSGVPVPTVAQWLGHRDGGALAMKVYGHLLKSHSLEMAKRVTFSKPAAIAA